MYGREKTTGGQQTMIPDTDSSLELFADKLLKQVGASRGEYPAYSEKDLRHYHVRRGETLECELSSHDQEDARDACRPFAWERRRIRRGFRALARRVFRMTALSRRQRSVVRLILSGRSLRGVAGLIGVSKTSVDRVMAEAVEKMRRTVDQHCAVNVTLHTRIEQGASCRTFRRSVIQNGGALAELETS